AQLDLITLSSLRFDAMLLPVVIAGAVAGRLLLRRVPQRLFEWITIALAIAAGLRLVTAG
ncbi:MAG: sulfite exporter TauE/SafE family protein, partial [Chthoniobacterales bacterium]